MNNNKNNDAENDNHETAGFIAPKMKKPLLSHIIPKMGGGNVTNEIPEFVKPSRERNVSGLTSCGVPSSSAYNMSGNTNFSGTEFSEAIAQGQETTASSSSITFSLQANLPPLPIPTLEDTMFKFLKHLEALQADDPEERDKTKRLVNDFLKPNVNVNVNNENGTTPATTSTTTTTTGPQLQLLLLEYDRTGRENGQIGSYVEEFWNDAYLAPDSSVVLNLNPYFVLESSPDPKLSGNQIRRAASLCFASVKMASQLRNGNLKPDTFRGKPLCMAQFRALFGASRVPQQLKDTISVDGKSNHVAVMCCNQLFYFQALWPQDGDVAVDEGDIGDILQAISIHAHKLHNHNNSPSTEDNKTTSDKSLSALGVLTSLGRKQWATAREEMIAYSPTKNTEGFKIVNSALFVLVLDDYIPKNKHEVAANMLHGSYELSSEQITSTEVGDYNKEYQSGSCTNRWYDKLQIIVTADGGAGINFEHSAVDGHTALRFVSDVYADTVISFAQSITKLVNAHDGTIPSVITANIRRAAVTLDNQGRTTLDVFPKKINFDLSDSIKRKIYFAETALGDQIVASDTHVLEFTDYGKRFITFNKLSPDSYVQMSMMLAYYKLYGKIVCAYEPVLTKAFYHGRTEAMRPATMEAKELCEIFCNPKSSPEEKLIALRGATTAHSKLVKECAKGQGCDRHLFSLKCIAGKNDLPIPEFFRSEPWKLLNHTILSTSNCGNPSLRGFGFGPVVPDGYGIGYIIKDSHLHYSICSKHRQTKRYALTLEGVLRDMASLLEPISNTKVHDQNNNSPQQRRAVLTSNNDSYGDIWGESSFQLTVSDDGDNYNSNNGGRPSIIDEKVVSRWSIGLEDGTKTADLTVDGLDNELHSPVLKKLNEAEDVSRWSTGLLEEGNNIIKINNNNNNKVDTIITADNLDKLPAPVIQKLNDVIEVSRWSAVLEERIGNIDLSTTDDDLEYELPAPVIQTLNDEGGDNLNVDTNIDGDGTDHFTMKYKLKRRGSNDLMPVRPDRRSSQQSIFLRPGELDEISQYADDQSDKQEEQEQQLGFDSLML